MDCSIIDFKDPRLGELIERFGQDRGLTLYLSEQIDGKPVDYSISEVAEQPTISVPVDKPILHFKGQLRLKNNRLNKISTDYKTAKLRNDEESKADLKLKQTKLYEEIRELEQKISELEEDRDLSSLIAVAHHQLDWVKSITTKAELAPSELTEATKVLEMWYNIKEIMYGDLLSDPDVKLSDEVTEELNALRARIDGEDLTGNIFKLNAEMLAQQSGYESTEKFLKELYKIEDLSAWGKYTSFLADSGVKFLTSIDRMNRDAVTRITKEFEYWNKRLIDDLTPVTKNGKIDKLFQLDSKEEPTGGLVNRYSQEWYDNIKDAYNKLKFSLSNATTDAQKRKAYKKLTDFLKNETVSVDIRYFVNEGFETREGVTKEIHLDYLKKEFGDVRAEELIQQALDQYQEYLNSLENIQRLNQEKLEDGEYISEEEMNEANAAWVSRNSPIIWLNQNDTLAEGEVRTYSQSVKNRYIVNKPKKFKDGKKTNWYDTTYEEIEKDPELLKAYETVREFMNEMMSYLPLHVRKDLQANFLPRVKKELVGSLTMEGLQGAVAGYPRDFLDSISSPAGMENRYLEETELGKLFKTIPIQYTQNIPVDERSKDLLQVLPKFAQTVLNYKWKSQIQDRVELANKFLDTVSKSAQRKEYTSDELENMKKSLDWFMESQVLQEKRKDEGVTDFKIFYGDKSITFEIKEGKDVEKIRDTYDKLLKSYDKNTAIRKLKEEFGDDIEVLTIKERYKRLEKKRDETEDKFYNGEITEQEYNAIIEPLEAEAKTLGRNLVWSKVGDKLMRYNQAMAFWFNPFSAFNNYMFGTISNLIWASGKVDFTPGETMRAFGLMWKSALNLKDKRLDKVTNLIAKFDLLYENLEYGSSDTENQTLKKLKAFPYVLLRKGDLFIKGQTLISLMLHKKINVTTIQGETKEISLFEAYNENGEWDTAKYQEDKAWDGNFANVEEGNEFIKFKNKVNAVQIKLHGNFDPNSVPMFKKYILGRMLGQFRASWMVEGIKQRFEKRRTDDYLERDVEGRYRTWYNLGFYKGFQVLGKIVAGHITGKVDLNKIPLKDRELVMENMRKNLTEIYLYAAMFSLYLILKAGLDDDDDNGEIKMTLNMLNRVMQDTTFYLSPKTFIEIIKDPLPVLSIPIRASRGFNSAINLIFEDDLTESEQEQQWRNITSNFYFINQYNKLITMQKKVF
jgi:hypothetical protein